MDITLLQDFPSDLKAEWNDLLSRATCNVPFLTYEYLHDWWQTRGGGEWPQAEELMLLVGREGDELTGIAPFFAVKMDGQKKLVLLGSHEISDFLDLIVSADQEEAFITSLLEYYSRELEPRGFCGLDFFNLIEDCSTISRLERIATEAGYQVTQATLQPSPRIALPGDWEKYLESIDKKQRHEIRRKMRRAVEGEVKVEVYFTTDPALVDQDAEAFMALMAQDPEKDKFLTPVMRQQFKLGIRSAFESSWLQLAFLRVGGKNAAAYLNFDYDNQIFVYNSGIDRSFMEYSPGWVLLGYLLQWANEHKRSHFDFMRGNEDYKYKFGAVDRHVCRVSLKK